MSLRVIKGSLIQFRYLIWWSVLNVIEMITLITQTLIILIREEEETCFVEAKVIIRIMLSSILDSINRHFQKTTFIYVYAHVCLFLWMLYLCMWEYISSPCVGIDNEGYSLFSSRFLFFLSKKEFYASASHSYNLLENALLMSKEMCNGSLAT